MLAVLEAWKTCTICGVTYPANKNHFFRDKGGRWGFSSRCKVCAYKKSREYKELNPEREAAYKRKHYKRHRERRRESETRYRNTNRDACNKRIRKWKKANNILVKGYTAKRRALLNNAKTEVVRYEDILSRDGLVCHICGDATSLDNLEFDHVIPVSKGGAHSNENIKVAHATCNKVKSDKLMEEIGGLI